MPARMTGFCTATQVSGPVYVHVHVGVLIKITIGGLYSGSRMFVNPRVASESLGAQPQRNPISSSGALGIIFVYVYKKNTRRISKMLFCI